MAASTETIFLALENSLFAFPEIPGRWEVLDFPGVRARATPQTSHPIGNLVGVATLTEANADAVIAQVRDFLVVYLSYADNVSRLLPNPLSDVNQPVICS